MRIEEVENFWFQWDKCKIRYRKEISTLKKKKKTEGNMYSGLIIGVLLQNKSLCMYVTHSVSKWTSSESCLYCRKKICPALNCLAIYCEQERSKTFTV